MPDLCIYYLLLSFVMSSHFAVCFLALCVMIFIHFGFPALWIFWITCEWSALKLDFEFIFCLSSSAFGSTIWLPCSKSLRVTLTHFLVDGFLRSCQKRAESFKNVTFLAWQTNWANTERQRFQWQINLNHISQRYQSKKKSYHLCSVV